MDIFNAENLSVSPFLFCTTALLHKERTLIFGSNWIREEQDELSSNILKLADGHYCKIVAVALKHKNGLIVSQVVYNEIKDKRTNRGGLCIIYGGVIKIEVFLAYRNICQSLFEELHNFINSHSKTNDALNGIYEMINLFQNPSPHEDLITKEFLEVLIQEMESKFYVKRKKRLIDSFKVRMRGFGHSTEVKPCRTIEQANEFWKEIDNNLSKLEIKEENNK
jgi:hypothetical protein